ncbi:MULTISPECIES: FMN-dependent NADH-azoreductase [unclassified Agarivorans]|uniref:FMN-dependent NADH-azoreductase n=1 Tax=unclassified Agarivorans TaxID=2636026 RepID=UPI003D7C4832
MTKILTLKSSILGEHSSSSALIDQLNARYLEQGAELVSRDLVSEALPVLTGEIALALRGAPDLNAVQQQALELSDSLIAELKSTDVLVVAAPMYNFSIPTQLKNWLDLVARAGVTFRYTENGPEGLVEGTKAIIVTTRGGMHKDGATDLQIPYLKLVLGFIGISDVEVVYAEGLAMGEDQVQQQMQAAQQQLASLV